MTFRSPFEGRNRPDGRTYAGLTSAKPELWRDYHSVRDPETLELRNGLRALPRRSRVRLEEDPEIPTTILPERAGPFGDHARSSTT